jgi:hypothetical protein
MTLLPKIIVCSFVLAGTVALGSCSPGGGACQKEFDCKTQLKEDLEDDYVAVCSAEYDGFQNARRANAEKECKDLATAQDALSACEGQLSCDDLVKSRARGDTLCKTFGTDFDKALKAADGGAKCTGVSEGVLGGGEGEGEGAGQ